MLQTAHETPFTLGMFLFPDVRGVDTLYVVMKATFEEHGHVLRVAAPQEPLCLADEYWQAPETSSLRYATDARLARAGTDILVHGHVYAPHERASAVVDASVRVGPVHAQLRAIGDRHFTGDAVAPYFTAPRPFTTMPLRWERAFGGSFADPGSNVVHVDRRNPVGRGFVPEGIRDLRALRGLPLPNLEDPRAPLQRPGDRPPPCATGPIAPSWMPRVGFAGTYDARWESHRAPFLPEDFDERFFHAAPSSLVSPHALVGGELVVCERLTPDGAWRFALPALAYRGEAHLARATHALHFTLDTVMLDTDARRVTLVHRASLAVDKLALRLSSVKVSLAGGWS